MIFRTALKYKIFEWCLDTFVNKLIKNFQVFRINGIRLQVTDLKPGMHLSAIVLNISGWEPVFFYDCKIIETYKINIDDYDEWIDPITGDTHPSYTDPTPLWDVKFTCARADGTGYVRNTSFDNHEQIQSWNTTEGSNELEFIV